jgi:secreted PhoX family phosphatase
VTDPHPHLTPAANRRQLLTLAGLGLVGTGLAGALGDTAEAVVSDRALGKLHPAGPELALPKGFTYTTFGRAGTPMSDGLATPRAHDGQGLFRTEKRSELRLVRNHEIDLDIPGTTQKAIGAARPYDRTGPGGVTSSLWSSKTGLVESHLVLNGTLSNCSGSQTPWGSWLSCEETTDGTKAGFEKPHGYVFEVPANATGPVDPVPLKDMGRFEHECAPVDPRTGIIYMTEDNGDPGDGFYRFLPHTPGKLHKGGRLQKMAGPRWSPDGSRLFINVQYPGVTCVIEGPWHRLR